MRRLILSIAAYALLLSATVSTFSATAPGVSFNAQEEKTVWVQITDTRGRPLPNITVSSIEGGKAVRTTSSGRAGVPVPNALQIQGEIHVVIVSKEYQTVNGLPVAIRIPGFNKPYLTSQITVISKSSRLANRVRPTAPSSANPELDFYAKGEEAVTAKKYKDAIQYFSKAYEERKQAYEKNKTPQLKKKYVQATRRLGDIFLVISEWSEASDKYQEVLRLMPTDDEAVFFIGFCAAVLGDMPQAEKMFRSMKDFGHDSMSRKLGGLFTAEIYRSFGKLDSSIEIEQEFYRQVSEEGVEMAPEIDKLFKLGSKAALSILQGESYPSHIKPVLNIAFIIAHKAEVALAEQKAGQFSPALITPLNNLTNALQMQARYEEAERLSLRILSVQRRLFGEDYLPVGFSLIKLADIQTKRKDYVAAEKHYREAAAILEKSLASDNGLFMEIHEGLATLFVNQERFDDAEHELKSVVEIACKGPAVENGQCVHALGELSEFYENRERYPEAVTPLRRAIDISKKLWAARDSVGTAIILEQLDDLEDLYEQTGNKQELDDLKKEKQYIAGLGIKPKEAPPSWSSNDAPPAISLNGNRCFFQSPDEYVKYPEAKEFLEALVRATKYLDYRDPDLNQATYLLAYLYSTQNGLNEAWALAEKALKANEDALQPDRNQTALLLNLKAIVDFDRGNYAQAERNSTEALKTMQVVVGQANDATIPFLTNLAQIQRRRLNYAEAEKNMRLALNISEGDPTNSSCARPDSVSIASELASLYVLMQRYPEAEKLFNDSLRAIGDCCLNQHPDAAVILENYADCLRRMGRNDEAAKQEARAKQLRVKP